MTSGPLPRNHRPVFVVGSPRSGTTLLYDMLLSAGGFAVYLGESSIFNVLAPRIGDLGNRRNREKMWQVWLGSKLFRVSGIDPKRIEGTILNDCRNAGDFLRTIMEAVTHDQSAARWAGNTPEEMLYLPPIRETIPDALVVHMIRDGRDVALSLSRKRYIRPFPWKERENLLGAGLYWEWVIERGRRYGKSLGSDYTEARFEQLVSDPRTVLAQLSLFLDHPLDYDRIQRTALGSVRSPNTSFRNESTAEFSPVGRWRDQFTPEQLSRFESLVGSTLQELGYPLAATGGSRMSSAECTRMRLLYRTFFAAKFRLKNSALFRALRPGLTAAQVDDIVIADEKGAEQFHRAAVGKT